jgi:hypothetical protein
VAGTRQKRGSLNLPRHLAKADQPAAEPTSQSRHRGPVHPIKICATALLFAPIIEHFPRLALEFLHFRAFRPRLGTPFDSLDRGIARGGA